MQAIILGATGLLLGNADASILSRRMRLSRHGDEQPTDNLRAVAPMAALAFSLD